MASDAQRGVLSSRDAVRLAEAFELSPDQVREDAGLVGDWRGDEDALKTLLQERHEWDASVAPYYVLWLRGEGGDVSE